MATLLATWDEPDTAEPALLHARLASVLGAQAAAEHVSIDPETGAVDVAVRFPEDLADSERNLRAAWVSAKVLGIVYNLFAEDHLVLKRIRGLRPHQAPPQNMPIRPRQDGDIDARYLTVRPGPFEKLRRLLPS